MLTPLQLANIDPVTLERHICNERDTFAGVWAGLTDEQMTHRPGPQSDWSVKDLMAHVLFWEGLAIAEVTALLRGEVFGHGDLHNVNATVFERNKDRSLAEVTAEFEAGKLALQAVLGYMIDMPAANPVIWHKAAYRLHFNTARHYSTHTADLRAYVLSLDSGD